MSILLDNCSIYHIPRTGGMYLRELLNYNDIKYTLARTYKQTKDPYTFDSELINQHSDEIHHSIWLPHDTERERRLFIIREPVSWYKSIFSYRNTEPVNMGGWSGFRPFDQKCASDDFETFINKVFNSYPAGFLTQLYMMFNAVSSDAIHMEKLYEGFSKFMLDVEGIKLKELTTRINTSPEISISNEMIKNIQSFERKVYKTYYG